MDAVRVGDVRIGDGGLVWIAGPCVVEEEDRVLRIAAGLKHACAGAGLPLVFKASFDKANRTSDTAWRGPGMAEGLRILRRVRDELALPVTTDVHLPEQAAVVAEHVDLLQVPAFLCRQTDLLRACGATGRPVNVKKGQFLAPEDLAHVIDKVRGAGDGGVLLTERGTSFGYHDLVVDFRSLVRMRALGVPVVFDATHSTQRPGALGGASGGERAFAAPLARAAVAVGVDAVFAEVHDDPSVARSDAATQLPLAGVPALLRSLVALHRAARAEGP